MSESYLRPIGDKVVIELCDTPEHKGLIALPENITRFSLTHTQEGIVRAAGPGVVSRKGCLMPPEAEEGQRVILKKALGTELVINGRPHVICEPKAILAVME